MLAQDRKFGTSVGSVTGRSSLPGSTGASQHYSSYGSSGSFNVSHFRAGPKQSQSRSDDGGSNSFGFVLVNCLVLGVVGYAFMTDDTRATPDAEGGFSFFRSDHENSFVVKPGKRAGKRAAHKDWRREQQGTAQTEHLGPVGFEFPDLGGNLSEPTGASAFLAPGQIHQLIRTQLETATASTTAAHSSRPILRTNLTGADAEGQTAQRAFDVTLANPSRYRRYSTPGQQASQVHVQTGSVAIEDAANGTVGATLRVLKGKLVKVTGQGKNNHSYTLHVTHGPKAKIASVTVKPEGKRSLKASLHTVGWSSNFATYFYLLKYGFSEISSTRIQDAYSVDLASSAPCPKPCAALREKRDVSHDQVFKRLKKVADQGAHLIYVVEEFSATNPPALRAILLQDMANRKWQIISVNRPAS